MTPANKFMQVFLTSSADKVLSLIVPYLKQSPSAMKVAFIPTAGDLYAEKPWQKRDRDKLVELGFKIEDIDIKTIKNEALKKKLVTVDIIFVAGGNTSYLLEKAQESNFLNIAREQIQSGTVFIGSSAGSMIAGPNIEVDKVFDEGDFGKELYSYDALGIVDFVVLPHADNPKYRPYIDKIKNQYDKKYTFTELKDDQALACIDGQTELLELSR